MNFKKFAFYPYDIKVKKGEIEYYYEVKSTSDPIFRDLTISRNEFNFYSQYKNYYNMLLISNVNYKNNILDNVANIYPNLIVNDKYVGFEGNNIYITPDAYTTRSSEE